MHYGTDVRLFCVLADNIDNVMLDIGVGWRWQEAGFSTVCADINMGKCFDITDAAGFLLLDSRL